LLARRVGKKEGRLSLECLKLEQVHALFLDLVARVREDPGGKRSMNGVTGGKKRKKVPVEVDELNQLGEGGSQALEGNKA